MARRNYSDTAVVTTLNGAITDSATSLIVTSSTGYPVVPFLIQINSELILVGAKSGTTFSSLTRGYGATSAAAHSDTDVVDHRVSATDVDEVWTHTHKTSDGHAAVSHDDATGVSADDHHAQSHTHASHTSIGTGDHHAQGHAAEHEEGGTDPLIVLNAADTETDLATTTSFVDYLTLSFVPPAGWAGYRILARGTVHFSGGDARMRIEIGSTNGTEMNSGDRSLTKSLIAGVLSLSGQSGTQTVAVAIKHDTLADTAYWGTLDIIAIREV